MTYNEAQLFVDHEQNEKYYSTSPLNIGNVNIIRVGEDGFIYRRETDYIKVVGVAELICEKFTTDVYCWNISEVVLVRK